MLKYQNLTLTHNLMYLNTMKITLLVSLATICVSVAALAGERSPNDHHRHLSRLVAVYPGRQILPAKSPNLATAAMVSLYARGDGGPTWSRVWKICLWARLLDGEHAWWQVNSVVGSTFLMGASFQGGLSQNLCNGVLQIEGVGYTAGVCEMLLQSHAGEVALLPALPPQWPSGTVRGLRARGAVTVDMAWEKGVLKTARLTADRDGQYKVRLPGKTVQTVELKTGQPWMVEQGK